MATRFISNESMMEVVNMSSIIGIMMRHRASCCTSRPPLPPALSTSSLLSPGSPSSVDCSSSPCRSSCSARPLELMVNHPAWLVVIALRGLATQVGYR